MNIKWHERVKGESDKEKLRVEKIEFLDCLDH